MDRQVYLGLTDGELAESGELLDDTLADIFDTFQPQRAFTLGPDGYDGHSDHIAMHESTIRVIRHVGLHSTLHALDSSHQGKVAIKRSKRKLGAMAFHVSQLTSPDPAQWGGTTIYTPLIKKETYNIQNLRAA